VREWAKSQKKKVSERGRVPAKLIEAYHAAGLR
ncbi:MAG TPA: histone-like nucleoid-structuring protein Lsr2, partial [Streptosporangiaceae bacterium]|nr:histone-like nucleoid-structuring protein Lsr2 [Streptosporangiaceae bacterium]